MRTSQVLDSQKPLSATILPTRRRPAQALWALAVAMLLVVVTLSGQTASGSIMTNMVAGISVLTKNLLTTALTTSERQWQHARNFNELSPEARPYYLHAVALGVARLNTGGNTIPEVSGGDDGTDLTAEEIALHLLSVESIYVPPPIPTEDAEAVADALVVHQATMRELNFLIAGKVANNSGLERAIFAGAIYGFFEWWWWDLR